jgi:kumamolisin
VTIFANQAHANPAAGYIALNGSYATAPAGAQLAGARASDQSMTITLVLQSSHAQQMNSLLTDLYNPSSREFHRWLKPGQFNAMFAPTPSQIASVNSFLQHAGLSIGASPSPFLVRATGTTAQINAALRTKVNNYVAANGRAFYQNDSAVQIPASLSGLVVAVTGLTNTGGMHSNYITTSAAAKKAGKATPQYGAGPGGSGLTPAQTSSLYNSTPVYQLGNRGKGQGATLAVFELSGYTPSDITTFEHQFYGPSENVKLIDVNVDGGPVTPVCPTGDQCGPFGPPPCANGCSSADYSGDIEVNADIENQLAIAPKISSIMVYNAPNDFNGTTEINEYFKIASDDLADSVSTSWGLCEQDAGIANIEAESVAFMQMAFQGQSVFSAAGDTGAFDCLRGSGFTGTTVDDPSSQPFVTAVGGTSFGSFDPGTNQHPSYPTGFETVWNVLNGCSATNLANCANNGAGGGGVSNVWAMPPYQRGAGVISKLSQKGPYCSLAAKGQYCRELPDVSANADEYTPYAEYCTGDPTTNSLCAQFSSGLTPPGWFGIGGTSLSSPLWSGVISLWDSVHGERFGNANFGLYQLYRSSRSYDKYFHDITGKNQTENNNGFYPVTPLYDMATGIGTPRIAGIVGSDFR